MGRPFPWQALSSCWRRAPGDVGTGAVDCRGAGLGEAHGKTLSVVPSAILYLNGDFDGGAFYFTELDAKTVTVSVPSCLSLGDKPSQRCGQSGQASPPQIRGALSYVAHSSDWLPFLFRP